VDSEAVQIQARNSRVRVIVTQTREQWMIAQETAQVITHEKASAKAIAAIPIAVSAHHVHLTKAAVEQLFGKEYQLKVRNLLSQTGQWAAEETVDVLGPRGEIQRVRILGPCRSANQIEIAETEAYKLGVDAPVRLSGDVADTPIVTLRGPQGSMQTNGLLAAKRHIHMSTVDAQKYGLKHGDQVEVAVKSDGRDLVFRDVVIRIDPSYITEMHIDTDEANAAHIRHDGVGELIFMPVASHTAHITRRHLPTDGSEQSYVMNDVAV
jgi:acetate kinase